MAERIHLSHPVAYTNCGSDAMALYRAVCAGDRRHFTKEGPYTVAAVDPSFAEGGCLHQGLVHRLAGELAPVVRGFDPARVAVVLGTCDYQGERSTEANGRFFREGSFPPGYRLAVQAPAFSAGDLARKWGARGVVLTLSTACSSSAGALVRGRELLQSGLADLVVAVGIDLAGPLSCAGFASLGIYAKEPCRPCAAGRDGVTLASALGALCMTTRPLDGPDWVLEGCGEVNEAYHITAPDPEGAGAEAAMRLALDDAALAPEEIGYVNLHGTGTHSNDAMECKAVSRLFGAGVPVSSTKGVTGHALGAAGIIETIICLETLSHGVLPVQAPHDGADPSLPPLDFVREGSVGEVRHAMTNSFAFGGADVSLVVGRADA